MDKHVAQKKGKGVPDRQRQKEKYKQFRGNKMEGQGFADKRKRKAQYEYMKMLQKEKKKEKVKDVKKTDQSETGSSQDDVTQGVSVSNKSIYKLHPNFRSEQQQQKSKTNRFTKVLEQQEARKEKKLKMKQEYLETKKKREEAMDHYQQRRKGTFKMICKKNYKGQPIMKNQMKYLLTKIEEQRDQT
ncbi:Coiled-coil domain containing 59 [Mactra antiquata]